MGFGVKYKLVSIARINTSYKCRQRDFFSSFKLLSLGQAAYNYTCSLNSIKSIQGMKSLTEATKLFKRLIIFEFSLISGETHELLWRAQPAEYVGKCF